MKNKAEEYNSSLIDEIFDSISEKEEKKIKSKMLLAARIEDAMKEKGWNRTKLLEATGQKNASVATKWFSGTHNFTHDTLFDIQEALEIELINTGQSNEELIMNYHIVVNSRPSETSDSYWNKTPMSSHINQFNSSIIIAEA